MKEESTSENTQNAKENTQKTKTTPRKDKTMKTTEKKSNTCPDCGKQIKKGDHLYGVYRDRYPGGHAHVCEKCYVGEKRFITRLYPR